MKIYSRILGILTFLIALFFLGVLFYFIFFEASKSQEKLIALIGLIPIYIVMHFTIIHRFGFNLDTEFSVNQRKIILSTSLILFGILLLTVIWQLTEIASLQKQEAQNKKELEELLSSLAKLRTWDKVTTAYGYEGNLKTKFENEKLYYQLNVKSISPFNPGLVGFTINFLDKDGFLLKSLEVSDFSVMVNKDKVYGISSNSTTDIFGDESWEVESIASWRLLVRTK